MLRSVAHWVAFADSACAPVDLYVQTHWCDFFFCHFDFKIPSPVAPALAVREALKKANLTVADISKFELNEAFSAVGLALIKILELDPAKINVLGGAGAR